MIFRLLGGTLLFAAILAAEVKFERKPDQIGVIINDRPFTTFYFGPKTVRPYLHPLRTATGKAVTRAYPEQDVPGEPKDHPHHRGLWFGHGEVNGVNFWANDPLSKSPNQGKVVLKEIEVQEGRKSGTIKATFDWNDPSGKTLLTEQRVMTFYSAPADERIMDIDLTLTPSVPLDFGDTKEGTFALRVAPSMDEKHTGQMMNAEGKKGMKDVWGSRSNWVDYAGDVNGEKVGIAIFDNSSNPNHPTHWHSRDYGLLSANPFGQKEFEKGGPEAHIKGVPGQPMRFQYRIIIHPGDAQTANIAQQWNRYAAGK